jgi:hypothetical protein
LLWLLPRQSLVLLLLAGLHYLCCLLLFLLDGCPAL